MSQMTEHEPTHPPPGHASTGRERTLLEIPLPWHAESVAEARSQVRHAASGLALGPAATRFAVLAVSELVTNAVEHGSPPIRLRALAIPGGLRLEVEDASPTTPSVLAVPTTAATGRGLTIVEGMSSAWGHYSSDSGKCVWCEIVAPVG